MSSCIRSVLVSVSFSGFLLLSGMAWAKGPGALVIVGGGDRPDEVMTAFMNEAGGTGATVCVVPTSTADPEGAYEGFKPLLQRFQATLVRVDAHKREDSSNPAILKAVSACTGIWFTGGDQNRVGDAIVGTPLHQLFLDRHRAGAAIGGTSAGAAIMSRVMLTGEDRRGEEKLEEIGPGAYRTREGMGFLPVHCIVDQHFLRRNRQNRLFSVLMDRPGNLGIGIDEETALVVKGSQARVLGNRKVMIMDSGGSRVKGSSFENLRIHLLERGQGFDLQTRKMLAE